MEAVDHLRSQASRKRWIWFVPIFICLSLVLRGCLLRPATNHPGAYFNRNTNAAWLGVEWVNERHRREDIAALAESLNRQQIKYVFAYTSYLKPNRQFNLTYSHAAEFVQTLKAEQPNLNVQAWIGLPLEYLDLDNSEVRKQIVQFCVTLVQEKGFDGIHLDPEPILNDTTSVLTLLDEVRQALGPEFTLSIATRRIWPIFPNVRWPIVGRIAWQADYYREVASRVDQIVVMTYDSAMPLTFLYRQWTQFQAIEVSRTVSNVGSHVFFGISASEEKTWTHWPSAENIGSGLQGIIDGLNDAEAHPACVSGVALYMYGDMDEVKWSVYKTSWLRP
jgi:hypothetical protein